MPSIMGIEALPTLSDTHQDAYRADTAHDIKALCYAMSGEQIPHRTIDASGTNLRDTEFSVAPNTRFIFDNADMRDATVLNITADGMTMRGNNTLIDNGYLSV